MNLTRNLFYSLKKQTNKNKNQQPKKSYYLWHICQEACLACTRPSEHTCNSSTWEAEQRVSEVQGHPLTVALICNPSTGIAETGESLDFVRQSVQLSW